MPCRDPCRDSRVARRLSPQEWQEPGVCSMAGADPDFLANEMNLRNSFWFTIGSLMQQGCDINPKYVAGARGRRHHRPRRLHLVRTIVASVLVREGVSA